MSDGDYPLEVCITNTFGANGPNIQVKHYYYPNNKQAGQLTESPPHTIYQGESLCFHLFWGEENLEINLNETSPGSDYYIWAGVKTRCYLRGAMPDIVYTPSPIGQITKNGDTFYCGGTWKLKKDDTSWTLSIKKYSFDPEEDEVIVGPGTPG